MVTAPNLFFMCQLKDPLLWTSFCLYTFCYKDYIIDIVIKLLEKLTSVGGSC